MKGAAIAAKRTMKGAATAAKRTTKRTAKAAKRRATAATAITGHTAFCSHGTTMTIFWRALMNWSVGSTILMTTLVDWR